METNPDFKDMWRKQKAEPPDLQELKSKVKQEKRVQMRRILISNFLLGATSLFIVFIWVRFNPEMITTKIGIILMVLAMGIFSVLYGRLRPAIKKIDESVSAKDYIENLLELKRKQQFLHTTVMNLYFILLSAGVGLYMIEYAMQMPLWGMILAYSLTASWIAFCWFYLRPRTTKKQQSKVDSLLEKFRNIGQQLHD